MKPIGYTINFEKIDLFIGNQGDKISNKQRVLLKVLLFVKKAADYY